MDLARDTIARADRMRSARSTFDAHWQEVRDVIIPLAASVTGREAPGQKAHGAVLDSTGEQANEMLAAALVSILTPDTVDWFTLSVADDDAANSDRDVALWLETAAARMLAVFRSPRSGFGTAQHEKMLDVCSFGTAGMFIADRPGVGIRFTTIPLRQLLLEEDADGRVDTVYRDFELTARQAVGRWGNAAGPRVIEAAVNPKHAERPFRFVHGVEPRTGRIEGKGRKGLPFRSIYVSVSDQEVIDEGGFHELPYVAPRWMKRGDEVYGRGCGMKALADVKMLQRSMKVTIKGVEKMIDPPLMVADDGILSPVRVNPSGLNYYRSGTYSIDPIKPLLTGGRPDLGEEFMAGIRGRIDNAFMKPLIQMIRRDRMTATEVLQVVEEGQRVLGPYLGRLKSEDLGPMIERVFSIMLRAGAFPPMPQALGGRDVVIEYVSPAVRQQRLTRARALAQLSEITGPLLSMHPELADNLDGDKAYRDTADVIGLPKDWLRPVESVQQMRQARQQAQQDQSQRQAAMEMVDTGANAVRALPALRQALASPTEAING